MFQATRRRLALWYTTVTAVLLLLFAAGFYTYVRSTLIERVDDTLSHVAEVVERALVIEPTGSGITWSIDGTPEQRVNVEASFRNNREVSDDDHIDLEWFSPTGDLLWSTFTESLVLPLNPSKKSETVTIEADRYGEPLVLRQLSDRVQIGRQVLGYLRVSHPWFEVSLPTQQLVIDLGIGVVLMVASVAAIGWLLSGLAMRPVHEAYQRLKQFTADASHELRNPIAMIQTNVQAVLVDSIPAPPEHHHLYEQLQVVERLTRRLGRLVDDLLFLARQDSGVVSQQRTTVALDEILTEVLEEQAIQAMEKGIALNLDFAESPESATPETFLVWGDRDQLARLFTNLVSNALQYTPPGGQVMLHLATTQEQLRGRLQRSHCITIKDTGIGIPATALLHLFDRFYRVDPARSRQNMTGSGLGLAIAKTIAETHQGEILVTSAELQGTTFQVILPASPKF